ncbi:signal transduction histidine kinase [Arthrobacter stackebrandtii]|uniref:histidine kinase n=1 Tax=Arthrobacter stackebrandtii TaxID=272161 RepID=A0ABS4YZ26_9MICC|nr:histidine kinase [Arthrobacter stackebrandtii]MBP2413989.1 signal transduction histidine kinase [Arthrobacter stackebrandtii]PYG99048.1 two-component sensor histidine kinase [Arthrobacter stackebrandtii]
MHSIYDWFRRHRFAVDFVLMSVLWLVVIPFSLADGGYSSTLLDMLVAGTFATALIVPLAWRRTRTVMAGSIIAGVAIAQWALNVQPLPADIAVPLVVYALAAFGPRWASLSGLALALLGAIMLVTRYFYEFSTISLSDLPYTVITVLMVWVLVLFSWTSGDLTRTKRLREQALSDRAHRLEIEAQHERELAASDERAHIAREMHDIVAHSLSVIITQADGARYASVANPEIAPETLATIAATGRSSLQEMRRLLGVLRGGDEASTRPLPGLGDLDELLLGTRAAGLPVDFSALGDPRRQLPPGAELTAYRVVQEGLTNVMKHAGPNVTASVALAWNARGLEITVRDDGRGATAALATAPVPRVPSPKVPAMSAPAGTKAESDVGHHPGARPTDAVPAQGGGNGLRGMSERVRLYEGTLSAGPVAGGGFGIAVFIPYSEH